MWEDVTVALSLLGFLGAIALVLAELVSTFCVLIPDC